MLCKAWKILQLPPEGKQIRDWPIDSAELDNSAGAVPFNPQATPIPNIRPFHKTPLTVKTSSRKPNYTSSHRVAHQVTTPNFLRPVALRAAACPSPPCVCTMDYAGFSLLLLCSRSISAAVYAISGVNLSAADKVAEITGQQSPLDLWLKTWFKQTYVGHPANRAASHTHRLYIPAGSSQPQPGGSAATQ